MTSLLYLDKPWQPVLAGLDLDSIDGVWRHPLQRVDEPNRARGGWSEVGRVKLVKAVDGVREVYIKRQQDFTCRQWSNPFRKIPTLRRELGNLQDCRRFGVPVPRPLMYAERTQQGCQQAVLVVAGLSDYRPLTDYESNQSRRSVSMLQRRRLLRATARLIAQLHRTGRQHSCLYSKHIFVRDGWQDADDVELALIDLEKARLLSPFNGGAFRDLDSLNRHAQGWSRSERLALLFAYVNGNRQRLRVMARRLAQSQRARL